MGPMANTRCLRFCAQVRRSPVAVLLLGVGLGIAFVILTLGVDNFQAGFRLQHRVAMVEPAEYTEVMGATSPADKRLRPDLLGRHKTETLTGTTDKPAEDLLIKTEALSAPSGDMLDFRLDCSKVQREPVSELREPVWSYLTTNEAFLLPYMQQNGLKVQKGVGQRREQLGSAIETTLLCSPRATDVALLPNEKLSKVSIINTKPLYSVGDTIEFRVDLYDGRGAIRQAGGDEVRMWLKSPTEDNSVSVRVVDLNNGSYLGSTELKWPGVTFVRVSLTYPREFRRLAVELRHTLHTLRWVTGIFVKGQVSEKAVCLPSLPIPGYATLCNLTAKNGGFPWYCGAPSHPKLKCRHWNLTGNFGMMETLPLTESQKQMLERIDRGNFKKLIPNDITVVVADEVSRGVGQPLPPCWSRPPQESWTSPSPRGWIKDGAWQPQVCSLPRLTLTHMSKCLKDTGLLLLGDSNMALFFDTIKDLMELGQGECEHLGWSAKEICTVARHKGSIIFMHHSKPFNIGTHGDRLIHTSSMHQAIPMLLQQNRTNNVIVIHYYVHNSFYTLHMYRMKVRLARTVAEEALAAHPSLKIIIRGPHIIYDGKQHHVQFGDTFGRQYTQIWREEFRGLQDRVWFMDLWDLSIAMENVLCHPVRTIVEQMIRVLFGYFCQV